MIEVKVIAASVAHHGKPLYALQCKYHRFIHGEVMTHRVFSRNAMSSRAVPVKVMLKQVWNDPAMPVHWGQNQPGMQAHSQLSGWKKSAAVSVWKGAARAAVCFAWTLDKLGLAKQVANRILEPWQWMHTIISSTEWDNFFELRDHPDAQPEFQVLAKAMKIAIDECIPEIRERVAVTHHLEKGHLHLLYVTEEERTALTVQTLLEVSAARCARVSYLTHDKKVPSVEADKALYQRLVGSAPLHASPVEHQAWPALRPETASGNFRGWVQARHSIFSHVNR